MQNSLLHNFFKHLPKLKLVITRPKVDARPPHLRLEALQLLFCLLLELRLQQCTVLAMLSRALRDRYGVIYV